MSDRNDDYTVRGVKTTTNLSTLAKRFASYKFPDGGWSVTYREDYESTEPFFLIAQGLTKSEATALAQLVFDRDKKGHLEILDHTLTSRGYWSPRRPEGMVE